MTHTPTSRTLAELKLQGWLPWVVEQWVPHSGKRLDLFGYADIIAVNLDGDTLVVQATTTGNIRARVKKCLANPYARICVNAGWIVECWGWKKYVKKIDGKEWRHTIIRLVVVDGELVEQKEEEEL